VSSNGEQRLEMAKSGFLSPVRLPFRHSGNIVTASICKIIEVGASEAHIRMDL
jgi:hypothetical protein